MIAAVLVHEVAGHGGTALLCGGRFLRFQVDFDAMGRAWTDAPGHRVAVLAGGIAAEVVLGAAVLAAATLARRRLLVRLALLLLALNLFHDGLPYGFWDACYLGPTGDVGRILAIAPSPALRWTLVLGLGAVYLAAMTATGFLLFRTLEDALGPLSALRAGLVAAALTLGMAVGYAAFDWDQLVPGVGSRPALLAAAVQAAIGVLLVARRRRAVARRPPPARRWAAGLAVAWALGIGSALAVWLWLREGVALA